MNPDLERRRRPDGRFGVDERSAPEVGLADGTRLPAAGDRVSHRGGPPLRVKSVMGESALLTDVRGGTTFAKMTQLTVLAEGDREHNLAVERSIAAVSASARAASRQQKERLSLPPRDIARLERAQDAAIRAARDGHIDPHLWRCALAAGKGEPLGVQNAYVALVARGALPPSDIDALEESYRTNLGTLPS